MVDCRPSVSTPPGALAGTRNQAAETSRADRELWLIRFMGGCQAVHHGDHKVSRLLDRNAGDDRTRHHRLFYIRCGGSQHRPAFVHAPFRWGEPRHRAFEEQVPDSGNVGQMSCRKRCLPRCAPTLRSSPPVPGHDVERTAPDRDERARRTLLLGSGSIRRARELVYLPVGRPHAD